MTPEVYAWVEAMLAGEDLRFQDVLEVGARDVNGSARDLVLARGPQSYVGVDIEPGEGVDEVVAAEGLVDRFGPDRFGLVVSTEMLEHVERWRDALWSMMAATRPDGLMLVTTRSPGFPRHDWPDDHWRFALEDFYWIWAGWYMEDLRSDPALPGVFIRARKPPAWDATAARARLDRLTVAEAPE